MCDPARGERLVERPVGLIRLSDEGIDVCKSHRQLEVCLSATSLAIRIL